MNRWTAATHFRTVHGLTEKSDPYFDVSSPRDMAILSRELCRHPEIFKYTGTAFRVFRDQASPNHIDMRTHNPVLQTGTRIVGADGLKTGYTKYAGYSLSASVERNGRRVIVVVMGVGVTDAKGEVIPKDSKRVRDRTISTLVERGYVREAGTADAPGNPLLYVTTQTFLEKYGLRSVADLPDLEEFAPDEKTAQLIRERLGAAQPSTYETSRQDADERALPSVDALAADAMAGALGVVEKIDFDSLTFNMDDE